MADLNTLPPVNQPPKPGPLEWWRSLEIQAKAFFSVGTLIALVIGATRGCDIVSASDLVVVEQRQDAVDTSQNRKLDELDAAAEQQFILNVILEQKVTVVEKQQIWANEALWRMARDLGLNEGPRGLKPPPTPSPAPRPTP